MKWLEFVSIREARPDDHTAVGVLLGPLAYEVMPKLTRQKLEALPGSPDDKVWLTATGQLINDKAVPRDGFFVHRGSGARKCRNPGTH